MQDVFKVKCDKCGIDANEIGVRWSEVSNCNLCYECLTSDLEIVIAKVLSPQSWQAQDTHCDTKAKKKRREASLDYAKRVIAAIEEFKNG